MRYPADDDLRDYFGNVRLPRFWALRMLTIIILAAVLMAWLSTISWAVNDWTENPAVIDSAEDKDYATNLQVTVERFEWHPSAADDDLSVENDAGEYMWTVRAVCAATNGESQCVEYSMDWNRIETGVYVKTIDGGTLYIHYKAR